MSALIENTTTERLAGRPTAAARPPRRRLCGRNLLRRRRSIRTRCADGPACGDGPCAAAVAASGRVFVYTTHTHKLTKNWFSAVAVAAAAPGRRRGRTRAAGKSSYKTGTGTRQTSMVAVGMSGVRRTTDSARGSRGGCWCDGRTTRFFAHLFALRAHVDDPLSPAADHPSNHMSTRRI